LEGGNVTYRLRRVNAPDEGSTSEIEARGAKETKKRSKLVNQGKEGVLDKDSREREKNGGKLLGGGNL